MNKNNYIIAFDLHGVLFNHDYKKMFQTLWECKQKWKLALGLANPFVWLDAFKLLYKKSIAEEYVVKIGNKYSFLKPFISTGLKFLNQQKPNVKTIKIVTNLKDAGYTLHLFSNIGPQLFTDLKSEYPQLFNNFSEICIPLKENNYLSKYTLQAFTNYLNKHNKKNKSVLFIDDKLKNIKLAQKQNIETIHFKSAEQLSIGLKKIIL